MTFSLTGFATVKREAVELPTNFTATVNAELRVGALEETVTVSGASPVVDVQSATKAAVSLTREICSTRFRAAEPRSPMASFVPGG